jgi:hypothetical protein
MKNSNEMPASSHVFDWRGEFPTVLKFVDGLVAANLDALVDLIPTDELEDKKREIELKHKEHDSEYTDATLTLQAYMDFGLDSGLIKRGEYMEIMNQIESRV